MSDDLVHIRELFAEAVPEIAQGVVEIKAVARERGKRTKVAVYSSDSDVDAIAACVGVRGGRIRMIVDRTGGERFDIVRWTDSTEQLIASSLQPAEILFVRPDHLQRYAKVFVEDDQEQLARGHRDLNRRLASELTGFEIEIVPVRRGTGMGDGH
jgi:N utilization substance protein A